MNIRSAQPTDRHAILEVILPIIREGNTYTLDPDLTEEEAFDYWMASDKETFVAEVDGQILGTYYVRANQGGRGNHVCNCGYMTHPEATGRGIARAMFDHSIEQARNRGFRAMQYNFVVSTNDRAVQLWESMGFQIVGRLPRAFRHSTLGYVDALIMHRDL